MRIAQVTYGVIRIPAPMPGAIEGHTLMISKRLAELGHAVTILDRKYSPLEPASEALGGVRIVRLSRIAPQESGSVSQYRFNLIKNRLKFAFQARRFFEGNQTFDVINVYDVLAVPVLLVGRRHFKDGTRIFYTHDSSAWPRVKGRVLDRIFLSLLGIFLRRLEGIIVRNKFVKGQFANYSKVPANSIAVIPPAIDTDVLSTQNSLDVKSRYGLNDKRVVLYVGRLSLEKGIEVLIKAARIVANEIKDVVFVLVGPYAEFDPGAHSDKAASTISFLIEEMRLQNNLILTGFVPLIELRSFFACCDIFVLPSYIETFGQVITEAMSYGKPVIATKTPGALSQIKDGLNGYLVDTGDAVGLADKIVSLLGDPEECRRIGTIAKSTAQMFDSKALASEYVKFYEGL